MAKTKTEYAVATQEFLNGEFNRIDDGRSWSHRNGRGYSQREALIAIGRHNVNMQRRTGNPEAVGAILMTREVTSWEPDTER